MENFVEKVHFVADWAMVTVKSGMMQNAKRSLTLTQKGGGRNDPGKAMPQYRVKSGEPDTLFIPRGLVGQLADTAHLLVTDTGPQWAPLGIESKLTNPREGQKETIDGFMAGLQTHKLGGILQAVTGAGKTVMACDIISKIDMRTLIVVPRASLMQQWRDQIIKWTNIKESEIGIVQGPKCNYAGKKIVIAMIHTLAARGMSLEPNFYRYFGVVAFDECHVVGAETFSAVAPMFWSRYRIGLTATPRRSDGMDPVFWWHLGPTLARFTKLQAKARIRIIGYNGRDTSHAGMVWGGNLNLGRYFNRIARSPERMKLLHQLVQALSDKDHDVLVLSDRISHLENLKAMLIASGVPSAKIGMLTGKVKQLDRKIILGTYGSAGMGVDIPRLSALVMATPHAEIEQAIGRVLRQGHPLVIDIVDTSSTIMCGWAMKRMKFYHKITEDIQDKVGLRRAG